MVYAQIMAGVIVNTIVIANPKDVKTFEVDQVGKKYDCVVQIDKTKPRPGIGWSADCKGNFKTARIKSGG